MDFKLLNRMDEKLDKLLSQQSRMDTTLALTLALLKAPAAFVVREERMARLKAIVDFRMLDNGSATATLTPVDVAGLPTTLPDGTPPPSWASRDPAVVVTPAADGMSATLAPATPPVLATGVIITASTTLPDGTAISGSGNPIDVVAGGPTGFQITEQ